MPITVKDMMATARAAVPTITPADAATIIEAGALVVDLREPPEVAASGKVAGALAIPRGLLEFKADFDLPSRDPAFQADRPVIVYCASGGRAALAGKLLLDLGYKSVHNLGGFAGWAEAGGKVER
jgi:rhodanese-related sulfurtransferase